MIVTLVFCKESSVLKIFAWSLITFKCILDLHSFEGLWSWGKRKINCKISNLAYDLLTGQCCFYNICCLLTLSILSNFFPTSLPPFKQIWGNKVLIEIVMVKLKTYPSRTQTDSHAVGHILSILFMPVHEKRSNSLV